MDPKPSDESPPCPACGATVAAPLTQTLEYDVKDEQRLGEPISIMVVYKCPCGHAFTHRVKFYPPTGPNDSPGK